MKKFKLSKQTIFTLLGILVIAGSIPLAVILVKQRQEIRKEAAEICGSWCAGQVGHADGSWCKCGSSSADSGYTLKGCTTSTSDCGSRNCCSFTQSSSGPAPTSAPSSPICGSWCAGQVGHADGSWCKCGSSSADSGYTLKGCTTSTSDCGSRSCCAFNQGTGTVGGNNQGAPGNPIWGLWQTGATCSAPQPTSTPTKKPTATPTKSITITPTPTITPKPPTPTPTIPLSCNGPCTTNSQCGSNLICSLGRCRNQSCTSETDCTCPGPTPTPTITSTPTPTPTTPVSCNETCNIDSQCSGSLICSSGYCRNRDCTSETDCSCPGPTSTPTPTPTIPVSCNQSCTSNSNCQSNLICSNSYCRNADCTSETDCSCPGPTATPTTVYLAGATPTPVVELPKAGFVLPTFGFVLGGILLIITSLFFIL